jgi:arylsulfatase A-like enzyme
MDIPATLLHVYGIPIPEDFDGSVLTELLADGLSQMPVEYQVGDSEREEVASFSISDEENEAMVEHLRALGYLE